MKTLDSFLDQKPLFYEEIDYERFPKIYKRIAHHFTIPKIIHVIGTNGKGTTGRFLAQMLHACGLHVGHYTSPHILELRERIWLDGLPSENTLLEMAHVQLCSFLSQEDADALSYFEYTTLLAMLVLGPRCDYVVLEAGLGGEFDASNVFPKILSIVTPIGYDHQSFLGNTIEEIATTKLNSIATNFIIAPQTEKKVLTLAFQKANMLGVEMVKGHAYLSQEKAQLIEMFAKKHQLPLFLHDNFITAYSALTFLGYDVAINCTEFKPLSGRYHLFLPNVRLDVGHNPMAAHALVEAYGDNKVILVYNSYADKAYEEILTILKPIISKVEIIPVENTRMVDKNLLKSVIKALHLNVEIFQGIDESKEYLVFGSFSVIEAFLKGHRER